MLTNARKTDIINDIIPKTDMYEYGFLKTFKNHNPFKIFNLSIFSSIKIKKYKKKPQYVRGIPKNTAFEVCATPSQSTKVFMLQKLGSEYGL